MQISNWSDSISKLLNFFNGEDQRIKNHVEVRFKTTVDRWLLLTDMETTHELSVGGNRSITFKKRLHDKTGLPTNEWSAIIFITGLEIDFSFYETIFKKWGTAEIVVDWEVVKKTANIIFENTDSLLQQSETMLVTLHKQIFGNEYEEKEGYFEFSGIEITESGLGYFEFDFIFWLESRSGYLMDPYFSYHVTFNWYPSLVGVKRQG